MKSLGPVIDALDMTTMLAILALLGLAVGVAWVFSPGWALVVVSVLVLLYAVLPDQRPT